MRLGHMGAILALFLIIPSVFAEYIEPQTQYSAFPSMQLVQPKLIYYKADTNITLNFHLYTAWTISLSDVDCFIHLYQQDGTHLLKSQLLIDSPDYYIRLNRTLFKEKGRYGYTVWCNTNASQMANLSLYGSFVSSSLFITESGREPDSNGYYLAVIIPLAFGLFLLIGGFLIGEEHALLRPFLFILSLLMTFVSSYFTINLFNNDLFVSSLSDGLGFFIWIAGVSNALLIMYLGIYLFNQVMQFKKEKREERRNY